jgi:type IV pilus assembly protein PilA
MNNVQHGFTLIELMIVVAIVGVLAAIALPAYQDYTVRAKMSEVLTRGGEVKNSITEFHGSNGHFPLNFASAGVVTTGVNFMQVVSGVNTFAVSGSGDTTGDWISFTLTTTSIAAALNAQAQQKDVIFTGKFDPDNSGARQLVWTCGVTGAANPIDTKYLPASCRN